MKRIAAITLALGLALPAAAQSAGEGTAAVQGPVLVELFTSQGCSACPPADALLHRLAAREDVLALALHVDYWDYIGWKDRFADPAHTLRQKGYAQAGGRRMIYTPQMIVMGADDVMGADAMQAAEAIARHKPVPRPVALELERRGSGLHIHLESVDPVNGADAGKLLVQLVRYAPRQTVRITRGELAGRTLSYANVVRDWQVVAEWDGAAALDLVVPLEGSDRAAVVVQQAPYGPVLAAAKAE